MTVVICKPSDLGHRAVCGFRAEEGELGVLVRCFRGGLVLERERLERGVGRGLLLRGRLVREDDDARGLVDAVGARREVRHRLVVERELGDVLHHRGTAVLGDDAEVRVEQNQRRDAGDAEAP